MAVNPRPNLAPDSQPWGRWVTETIRNLEGNTSSTKREIIASSKNHNAQLQLSARQGQMITDVQGELDEANSRLEAAQELIDELNDVTLPGLEGDLTGMQNALDAAEGRLGIAEGELTDLTTNVLPGITGELDGVQGELTDHAARMLAAEQAVTAAEGRLTNAEAELSTLETGLGTVSGNIGDLIGRVDTVETGIGTAVDAANQAAADAASAASDASDANQAALNAVGIANGKGKVIYQASAPTGSNANANNLWIRTSDNKPHTYNGETWVAVTDKAATDAAATASAAQSAAAAAEAKAQSALSAAQAADGKAVLAQQSADGKSTVTYGTSKKASNAAGKEGDTHYVYSGANLIATQRRTATAWVDAELGHQIIGSVDLGKATVGQLDGQFIAANTVTAQKLVIAPANLFPDPHFNDPSNWSGTDISVVEDSDMPGGTGLRILGATAQRGSYYAGSNAQVVALEPGGKYRVRATVKVVSAGQRTSIYFTERTGGVSATSSVRLIDNTASEGVYNVEVVLTAPTSAGAVPGAKGTFGLYTASPHAAGTEVIIGAVSVQRIAGATLIEDGAITTDKVAANAITGAKILAGSITATDAVFANGAIVNADIANLNASKINAGELDAARIGAGSITADKLTVGGTANAIADPNFESEASWQFVGSSDTPTISTGGYEGLRRLTIPQSTYQRGAYLGGGSTPENYAARIPVAPGDTWRVAAKVRSGLAIPSGTSRIGIFVRFYATRDENTTTASLIGGADSSIAGGTWGDASGTVTVPDGKNFMSVGFFKQAAHNSAVWWSAPVARLMTSATLIENGAITTDKVAANAITGAKIKAGSITASHGVFATGAIQNADIGNLNASKINAGTLNAARIGSKSITGDKIAANSITANHGVFATGAIQAADIGSINANTITVGTLSGINISGVTITGQTTVASGGGITSMGDISVLDANGVTPRFTAKSWGIEMMAPFYNQYGDPVPNLDGLASIWIPTEERGGTGYQADWNSLILETGVRENPAKASLHVGRSTATPNGGKMVMGAAASRMAASSMYNRSLVITDQQIMPPPERGHYDPTVGGIFFAQVSRASQGYADSPRILPPVPDYSGAPISAQRMKIYQADIGPGFIDSEDRTIVSPVITGNATINGRSPIAAVYSGSSFSTVAGSATRTSDQTISSTSLTQISLTSLNSGSSGVSLAAGGVTGSTRGVYAVEVNIQFDGGSSGSWRNVMLYVNNSEFRRFATVVSGDSRVLNFTATVVVDTDSPSFKLYTNGGGTGMRVNSGVTMYVTRIGG